MNSAVEKAHCFGLAAEHIIIYAKIIIAICKIGWLCVAATGSIDCNGLFCELKGIVNISLAPVKVTDPVEGPGIKAVLNRNAFQMCICKRSEHRDFFIIRNCASFNICDL